MKLGVVAMAVLISACSTTVPVVPDFPKLPQQSAMTVPCPDLKNLQIGRAHV